MLTIQLQKSHRYSLHYVSSIQRVFIMYLNILVFVTVFLALPFEGYSIQFMITPNEVSSRLHADVNMSCRLDHSDVEFMRTNPSRFKGGFNGVSIQRDNETLADIDVDSNVRVMDSSIECTGHVSPDGKNSFLEIIIRGLKADRNETYVCVSHVEGDLDEFRNKSVELVVTHSMEDALKFVNNVTHAVLRENRELKTRLKYMENKINLMNEKANQTILFRAQMNKDAPKMCSGRQVRFKNVTINEGGGYMKGGYFKAPVSGYYFFQVGWYVQSGSWLFMDIVRNLTKLTRILGTAQDNWRTYAEGSVIAKIYKDDVVYPFVSYARWSWTGVERKDDDGLINKFSGYLIKAL